MVEQGLKEDRFPKKFTRNVRNRHWCQYCVGHGDLVHVKCSQILENKQISLNHNSVGGTAGGEHHNAHVYVGKVPLSVCLLTN